MVPKGDGRRPTSAAACEHLHAAAGNQQRDGAGLRANSVASVIVATLSASASVLPAHGQSSEEALAKATLNPVAALISVPIKLDYDHNIGSTEEGRKYQLTVTPVVPFSIGRDWNLISRSIIPLIKQQDVTPGAGTQSGLGDITQQFYFSPKPPTAGGWIWGIGPQFLLRTGTNHLGAEKWGAGPAFVALRQDSGWTVGTLMTHTWDFAGKSEARDINATFFQPFLTYTTRSFTSFTINSEATYDWVSDKWSVPINLLVSQLLKIGGQPLTIKAGVRYWATTPDGVGPKGWGSRVELTLLFPK